MKVTIGELCDKLSIVNIKIFMLENIKRDESADDKAVAEATRKTNKLNSERSWLVEAIDLELNELAKGNQQKLFGANKMYGK